MDKIILSEKTVCTCGEEIEVSVREVLSFDSIECPACGTDVYHSDAQYHTAESIAYIY